jgi:hypothetical protein
MEIYEAGVEARVFQLFVSNAFLHCLREARLSLDNTNIDAHRLIRSDLIHEAGNGQRYSQDGFDTYLVDEQARLDRLVFSLPGATVDAAYERLRRVLEVPDVLDVVDLISEAKAALDVRSNATATTLAWAACEAIARRMWRDVHGALPGTKAWEVVRDIHDAGVIHDELRGFLDHTREVRNGWLHGLIHPPWFSAVTGVLASRMMLALYLEWPLPDTLPKLTQCRPSAPVVNARRAMHHPAVPTGPGLAISGAR